MEIGELFFFSHESSMYSVNVRMPRIIVFPIVLTFITCQNTSTFYKIHAIKMQIQPEWRVFYSHKRNRLSKRYKLVTTNFISPARIRWRN